MSLILSKPADPEALSQEVSQRHFAKIILTWSY